MKRTLVMLFPIAVVLAVFIIIFVLEASQ